MKLKKRVKAIGLDILGFGLVLLSPLLGWLPGPGGIPIFLAGLSLLSVNHVWADRLRKKVIKDGTKFFMALFSKHPFVRGLYDFLSAALIFVGIYLINTYTKDMTLTFAIFSLFIGLALFLGNRERLQNLVRKTSGKKIRKKDLLR